MPTRAAVIAFAIALVGCAARYGARTTEPGKTELQVSLGGPIAQNLGAPLPLPHTRVGASHGLSRRLEASAGVHTTAAAFGVAGADVAAKYQVVRQRDWALAAGAVINAFAGVRSSGTTRVYPELGVHAERRLAARWRVLGGALALGQMDAPDSKPPVLAAPYAGLEYGTPGGARWAVTLAWISPWQDSTSVVDYAPATAGAFLIQFGHRRTIAGGGR